MWASCLPVCFCVGTPQACTYVPDGKEDNDDVLGFGGDWKQSLCCTPNSDSRFAFWMTTSGAQYSPRLRREIACAMCTCRWPCFWGAAMATHHNDSSVSLLELQTRFASMSPDARRGSVEHSRIGDRGGPWEDRQATLYSAGFYRCCIASVCCPCCAASYGRRTVRLKDHIEEECFCFDCVAGCCCFPCTVAQVVAQVRGQVAPLHDLPLRFQGCAGSTTMFETKLEGRIRYSLSLSSSLFALN